jgi:P27 family predicted phage terminase small subunit
MRRPLGGRIGYTNNGRNRAQKARLRSRWFVPKNAVVRPGPKLTPTSLKRLRGNPGKHRLSGGEPDPSAVASVDPPDMLSDVARQEWQRLAPELLRLGLLTVVDLGLLAMWCSSWATFCEAERQLSEGPLCTDRNGLVRRSPWIIVRRDAVETMLKVADRMGFSPSARVALATHSGPKSANGVQAGPSDRFIEYLRRKPDWIGPNPYDEFAK